MKKLIKFLKDIFKKKRVNLLEIALDELSEVDCKSIDGKLRVKIKKNKDKTDASYITISCIGAGGSGGNST